MSILIVGDKGNMGRRYHAICNYLHIPVLGLDANWSKDDLRVYMQDASQVIVATPTSTHCEWIRRLLPFGKPILCEKPITKDLVALDSTLREAKDAKVSLSMVYQYKCFTNGWSRGESVYDYWNHGKDGLVWDCIQIIGLAKEAISLREESPIWNCWLNGVRLDIGYMDHAYVQMIRDWSARPQDMTSEIWDVHQKTYELALKGLSSV